MHGRAHKQYILKSYNTSTSNAMCFDGNPFTCQCEIGDKRASHFALSLVVFNPFTDIMAVKGLTYAPRPHARMGLVVTFLVLDHNDDTNDVHLSCAHRRHERSHDM